MSAKSKTQSNGDPLRALSQKTLARIAAKLVASGRMPQPGALADALASLGGSVARARLSRDDSPNTEGPYHRVFVSSSTRDNSKPEHARAGLRSPAFHDLVLLSHRLPAAQGGQSGLGYWADGAEESRIVNVSDPAKLDEIAARLGKAFNQKSVLHFASDPGGSDIAHVVRVPTANADQIAESLTQHGIEYKTIVPDHETNSAEVHIIDMGGSLTPHVSAFASEHHGHHRQHLGHASYMGADTREEAALAFDRVIGKNSESPHVG